MKLTIARCPECGREFNPSQPDTYNSPSWRVEQIQLKQRRRLEHRAAEPTAQYCLVVNGAVIIAAFGVLWLPWPLGMISIAAWIALAGIALRETFRAHARAVLALPAQRKPVLGFAAWKLVAIVVLSIAAPLPLAVAFLLHLSLFAADAKEIEHSSFHEHPPPRLVGLIWVEVDRCPNGIFFITSQDGNPFSGGVTLVRRTSSGSCDHVYGLPIWKDWYVKPGKGRGRPLPIR